MAQQSSAGGRVKDGTGPTTLFERLFSSLLGGNDTERQKRRQLKIIAKRLSRSRYKYYKPRTELALPGLARFFLDIYKVIGPAQKLLHNARESKALQQIVIEHFFTDEQRAMRENLYEESLRELAESKEPKELAAAAKAQLQQFYASFETATIRRINAASQLMQRMFDLVSFDYFFVLRKFDGSFPEDGFNASPKFDAINATYVCDDLKDFLEVLQPLPKTGDWDAVLEILKEYRNVDVVNRSAWKKLLGTLDSVRRSDVLADIVRHAEKDPWFEPAERGIHAGGIEPYLEKVKHETESVIQAIMLERRKQRLDKLCMEVFGTTAISRSKNYTQKVSEMISARAQTSYRHTDAINYLKAFLIDYFKKDIRELQDMLVVRGQWADSNDEQELSSAFHRLMDISSEIIQFDDSLGDEGELGMKLRRSIGRSVASDPGTQKLVIQTVDEINARAESLVNMSAQNLIQIGKTLKGLIDDFGKRKPEILLNWREIEGLSEQPIQDRMVAVYKQIYFFIQLLQLYQKKKPQKARGADTQQPADA